MLKYCLIIGETTEEEAFYTVNTVETKISVREHGLIKKHFGE